MSSKKLSERLETLNLDGTTVGWEDCQHCESIIEAVRELEAENERLKSELASQSATGCRSCDVAKAAKKRELEALRERDEARNEIERVRFNEKQARLGLTSQRDGAYRERDALRVEVEALKEELTLAREGGELFRQSQYRVEELHLVAIRERDEARAKLAEQFTTLTIAQGERDEARADWEDESDKLYAERDALRAEMETLQRDKDGRIREAFDRMSVAIRERDEARAELAERDAALYEGKSAHEWYSEAYQAAVQRNTYIETAAKGINKLTDERDAALAKLAAARSYVGVPGIGLTARGCASVLNIIDGQKECNINNHCWCEMLDGHVECSKCGQKESDTAPVAAHETLSDKLPCGEQVGDEADIETPFVCEKMTEPELETLAAEIRHGREVADAREVYLQKKCAHKYGFRYSGASGGCDPWSVYKCIMCNFETVSPSNLDKDWEKRVKKAP